MAVATDEDVCLLKEENMGPWTPFRPALMVVGSLLFALVLTASTSRSVSAQDLEEYAFLLGLAGFPTPDFSNEPLTHVCDHEKLSLFESVEKGRIANLEGNDPREVSRLSKAIGAAHSIMALTHSCDPSCDETRAVLQQIIGRAGRLRARAIARLGHPVDNCPNGVINVGEECDPLAAPTGCETRETPSFCTEECLCIPIEGP